MKKLPAKKVKARPSHLRQSKTENFLEKIRENNSMVEYITGLRIMNPAALLRSTLNEPRREGGFVRLAHAREEFTAPVLNKGKSATSKERKRGRKSRGARGKKATNRR